MGASSSSSSSSPIPPQGYSYEVFLSFRGEDTRKTFTDHLYTDLVDKGINTFRDDEELPKGEAIKPELLKAINQSKVSVPILSKGYASSKWCLMELAQMVKCMKAGSQKIIPIFYHVEPREVRHQEKEYAKAFSEHKKKHPSKVVEEWSAALKTVGELKGWTLDDKGYEGRLMRDVVWEVMKELKKDQHIDITDNLVGIDDHVDEIMDFLDIDIPDIRIGGIWGMVGTGKTTIAKFIYNKLMHKFVFCSFVGDISKAFKSNQSESLRAQLVSDIFGHQSEKFFDVGKKKLMQRIHEKKVLIVLDDVDQAEQLNFFHQIICFVATGSRIIITTRNKNILEEKKVDLICEVKEMDEENALLLFCKRAFKQDFTVPKYDYLSRRIVKAIGGVPLAIEVVASYLSNHLGEKAIWEELRRLSCDPKIQSTIRVVIDSLKGDEKEIFLDIACLLHGMDKRIPVSMWTARGLFPLETINNLRARCLIKLTEGNKLWMHNLLRDYGRELVRDESHNFAGKQSRLWSSEDGLQVLDRNEGTEKVQAICLARSTELEKRDFSGNNFKNLSRLLFLDLGYTNLNGVFERGLPPRLKWISWHGVGDTGLTLPLELYLNELVVLDLSESSIRENWCGWSLIQEAKKLEVLNLKSCQQLESTPLFKSCLPIKILILEDCHKLIAVHSSIRQLKALESLNLKNCRILESLPNELGSLVELTELIIDKVRIKRLPEGMTNLETLSAKSCESLTELSLSDFESLEELNLSHTPVVQLSFSSRKPRNLQVLDVSYSSVSSFPHSLMDSRNLEVINASACQSLEGGVPSELGSLTYLRILRLDNTRITSIPESIRDLCHLEVLHLGNSKIEETLPELPSSLVDVTVTCRSSVTVIPNLPNLVNLKELEFIDCYKLDKLPKDINRLSKLRRLKLNWTNVVAFPKEMVELHQLRELNISNCHKLESLPELPSGLRRLLISDCSSLSEIPNLGKLKSLRTLRIRSPLVTIHGLEMSSSLVDLSLRECAIENSIDFSNLEGISNLEVAFCGKLQKIEGIHSLRRLKRLKILYCETLQELEGIQGLVLLEEFLIYQCPALENFPDLSLMRKLKVLKLQFLEKYVEMEGLVELVSLETLVISRCNEVWAIPNLSGLQQLKTLQLHGLQRVEKIQGLDKLLLLEVLLVSFCHAITTLPSLLELQKLKSLSLRGLGNVSKIEGLSGLVSLESLTISYCGAIAKLPDLSMLQNLRELELQYCGQLPNIQKIVERKKLKSLVIQNCEQMENIPALPNLETRDLEQEMFHGEISRIGEEIGLRSNYYSLDEAMFGTECYYSFEIMPRQQPELFTPSSHASSRLTRQCRLFSPRQQPRLASPVASSLASPRQQPRLASPRLASPEQDSMVSEEIITAMELQSPEIITEKFIYKMVLRKEVAIHGGDIVPRALNFVVQRLLKHKGLTIPEISWLITVSEMEWLERLSLLSCHSLEALPDMSKLHKLKHLKLINCSEIKDILGLSGLESLEELLIENCEVLGALPNPSSLPKLKHLKLINCSKIKDILGLNGLESLEELLIENCEVLDALPNLSSLPKLKILNLSFCNKVKNIRGVNELEELVIHNCHALDALPDLHKLKKLKLIHYEKLKDIHGFSELESLEEVVIQNFDELDSLRNLSGLQKLKKLKLIHCEKLKDVHGLSELESLEELVIQDFDVLDTLPNLSGLQKLKKLKFIRCEKLKHIHMLIKLESLEELLIETCDALDALPPLNRLKNLKILVLDKCQKLKNIQGIRELELLEELTIEGCNSLETFPNLVQQKKLNRLVLRSCPQLKFDLDFFENKALSVKVIKNCPLVKHYIKF